MTTFLRQFPSAAFAVATLIGVTLAPACNSPNDTIAPLVSGDSVMQPLKTISYVIQNYCTSSPQATLGGFFLLNASYVIQNGQVELDTDRDGIPDVEDNDPALGLNPLLADSGGFGFGDLAVYNAGLTIANQLKMNSFSPCADRTLDTDGDGLSDCSENALVKTSPTRFDTDGDGIPDELELRFGLNPLDPNDAQLDPGGDGLTNLQKVQMQLPVRETVSQQTQKNFGHQYQLTPITPVGSSSQAPCYDLTVTNIPVISAPNGNLIITHMIETQSGGGAELKLNRCCSLVPSDIDNQSQVTVTWQQSPELVCPCPVLLDLRE